VDTGPIIIQKVVPVLEDDSVDSLSGRILEQEHKAYAEAVRLFAEERIEVKGRKVIIKKESSREY
jgi:phosphoribosylglycinamide formyltransferase-1